MQHLEVSGAVKPVSNWIGRREGQHGPTADYDNLPSPNHAEFWQNDSSKYILNVIKPVCEKGPEFRPTKVVSLPQRTYYHL